MDANDFFRIHKKELNKKIEFQERIDNLDQDSIDDLIHEIKSYHCNDKEDLRVTLYMIRKAAFSHPKNIFLYVQIIEEIIDSIKFFFTGDELALIFRFISNKLIFLKLFNLGAIKFKSVFKMIKSFHSNLSYIEPLIYFYPEIKKDAHNIYLKTRLIINKEVARSLYKDQCEAKNGETKNGEANKTYSDTDLFFADDTSDTEKSTQYFLCDDPEIEQEFIKMRETGMSMDSLAIAIRNDNVEQFQSILSKTNTSVNDCVKYSIFEQCNVISKRRNQKTLRFIEYAAFFGSVNIFKFLLNTAELTEKTAKNAIKGGNYEIIHLCEQYKIQFSPKCLTLAIRFHRNEIVDYLLDNYPFKFDIGTTIASIQYYNWEIMCRCIPIYLSPDPNISNDNFSALATASINGYLDIVQILCSLKNIDINYQSEGWNPVMYAAFKGYVYILQYFMSRFKSVDCMNDENFGKDGNINNDETDEKEDCYHIAGNDNENSVDNENGNTSNDSESDDDDNERIKNNNNTNNDNENNNNNDDENNNNNDNENNNNNDDEKTNNDNENNNNNDNENNNNIDYEKTNNDDENNNNNENPNDDNENSSNNENNDNASSGNKKNKKTRKITNIINLNQRWDGRSPIEIAIYSDELNAVKYLLQFNTVYEDSKKNIDTLLHISSSNRCIEIEKYLREVFNIDE